MPPAAPVYPGASYAAPAATAAGVHYAGFWMRFVAVVIDSIIVGVVTGPLMGIIQVAAGLHGGLLSGNPGNLESVNIGLLAGTLALMVTISVAASALYEAWLISTSKQATVGKMVFRIKVTDLEGRRISFARALGRHFAKYVSSFTLMIGYIMQVFTARRQALHDIIAGTLVIRDVSPPYAIVTPQPPAA